MGSIPIVASQDRSAQRVGSKKNCELGAQMGPQLIDQPSSGHATSGAPDPTEQSPQYGSLRWAVSLRLTSERTPLREAETRWIEV